MGPSITGGNAADAPPAPSRSPRSSWARRWCCHRRLHVRVAPVIGTGRPTGASAAGGYRKEVVLQRRAVEAQVVRHPRHHIGNAPPDQPVAPVSVAPIRSPRPAGSDEVDRGGDAIDRRAQPGDLEFRRAVLRSRPHSPRRPQRAYAPAGWAGRSAGPGCHDRQSVAWPAARRPPETHRPRPCRARRQAAPRSGGRRLAFTANGVWRDVTMIDMADHVQIDKGRQRRLGGCLPAARRVGALLAKAPRSVPAPMLRMTARSRCIRRNRRG